MTGALINIEDLLKTFEGLRIDGKGAMQIKLHTDDSGCIVKVEITEFHKLSTTR